MVEIKNIFTTALFGLLLMATTNIAYAATIIATVDRHHINEGESFQLNLEIKGDADDNPDFRPLQKYFEILNRNKSNSMQIINGRISSKSVWELTLMPKQKGEITIPPIAFGKDHSNSVKITVSKDRTAQSGSAAKDIFLQVSVNPSQTYVQAQVIYTIQVYISTNIANASLSEPKLSDADAVIEKLGEDRRFGKQHQGRHYEVVERRYAIFPQQSGKLKIDPVVFDAQLVQSSRYRMNPFPQHGQTKRIQSKAVEINIKAIPAKQKGKTWLPARHVQLKEEWPQDPPKFKVGEAVTRTLTLGAEGLTAAQLPKIFVTTTDGFKAYPDQPVLNDKKQDNGIIGIRQEKIAMIATRPGHYELPEIKISWWNTKTQQREVARIAKRKIQVVAADGSPSPGNISKPGENQTNNLTIATTPSSPDKEVTSAGYWPWLSLSLASGWLATLFFMWRQNINNTQVGNETLDHKSKQALASRKQAERKIKQACLENNPNTTKEAILNWGKILYPDQNLNSLSEIGKHIGGAVADNIIALNQTLYSSSENDWQGQGLWDSIQEFKKSQNHSRPQTADTLAPLYPSTQ